MRIHDSYARVTPYEIAIPGREFAQERFELIQEEAGQRGADIWDPGAFSMLAQSGDAVRDIRVEDEDPVLFVQYGVILFHAFHFWNAGEPLYLVRAEAAGQLVAGPSASGPADWSFAVPDRAGYAQLPHHLFWARPDPDGPAEPVDGFFWALTPAGSLHLMAASGMRADRPGFGVLPVPGIPAEEASRCAAGRVRERGEDFESTLPGGEELCSIETLGEVVKLAGRLFWKLEQGRLWAGATEHPGRAAARAPEQQPESRAPGAEPLASTLPYRPITPRKHDETDGRG